MKKKILSMALALCLAFGAASFLPSEVTNDSLNITASAAGSVNTDTSGKCGDDVSWSLS